MSSYDPTQVYSATYSNVPVFEFVTVEGPIMRRKLDSWINATHILKIAKFPKARRTRILEKDVQTGIHEKVQGGYGKYQGTYVPLEIGKEIATSFGVYDILKPIFDFEFIEGTSQTPPPAPKHNHASASNMGRKALLKVKQESGLDGAVLAKRTRSGADAETSPKRKARTKRVTLTGRGKPDMNRSQTVPIDHSMGGSGGPSIGTFSAKPELGMESSFKLPPLQRQDTDKDVALFTASSMNVRREDLELEPESGDDLHDHANADHRFGMSIRDSYDEELMTGRELFGSREFAASKESFDRYGHPASRGSDSTVPAAVNDFTKLLGSESFRSFPSQRHGQPQLNSTSLRGDPEAIEYFNVLLNYLLDENPNTQNGRPKALTTSLPDKILNPPLPLSRIIIDQPIDSDGNTIFHWACAMANVSMIEFLLSLFSLSINTQLKNYRGETALMFLVQFNNSYILNNFTSIFDLLFDSVLSTDSFGRTVLHHIALACEPPATDDLTASEASMIKENFAKYYFEVVLAKIVKFPEFQVHNENEGEAPPENKKDVVVKFINHQDNEGNTALHIVAFGLARKCIRTFIKYHVYIDFALRNLVNCTIEDYLASHNYVLRLEGENDELLPLVGGMLNGNTINNPTYGAQSFESQMLSTRLALSLQSSVAHRVTEQLSKLSFQIEKELKEYDQKIFDVLEFYKLIGKDKIKSQKSVLHLFNLDYLLEDAEKEFENNLMSSQHDARYLDSNEGSNDNMIQEEIKRLMNDLRFKHLSLEYEFEQQFKTYVARKEIKLQEQLLKAAEKEITIKPDADDQTKLLLATKLQKLIIKRKELSEKIYGEEVKVPLAAQFPEEFKENSIPKNIKSGGSANGENGGLSLIAGFPKNDNLYKYCKLISLSCGMSFAEVENSVDLIEQSLARSVSNA